MMNVLGTRTLPHGEVIKVQNGDVIGALKRLRHTNPNSHTLARFRDEIRALEMCQGIEGSFALSRLTSAPVRDKIKSAAQLLLRLAFPDEG
jgi:hypothetical protein